MTNQPTNPPEFNGRCAFAVSLGKKEVAGRTECHAVQDGKTYLFSNPVAKFLWSILPGRKHKAESVWRSRASLDASRPS
jgi:hypothetical protein